MSTGKKYLVVIAGPTGVGKTALAIQLAKYFNTEIISADSRQFYRETSIGTAKPSQEELNAVTHHFINTLSIHQNYCVGDFEKDVIKLLHELFTKHNIVFLVGGSGLYIDAVLYGVDEFIEVSEATRHFVKENYSQKGISWLQEEVKTKDPVYFSNVDQNNPQRLMRALEVCNESGKPYSSFLKNNTSEREFETIKLLINQPREILYEKINKRVDKMVADGLEAEAQSLYPFKHLNALNTVGYKEWFMHFSGEITREAAIDLIKQKTRNYAKRQLTWFNNQDNYEEFGPDDFEKLKAYIEIILQHS